MAVEVTKPRPPFHIPEEQIFVSKLHRVSLSSPKRRNRLASAVDDSLDAVGKHLVVAVHLEILQPDLGHHLVDRDLDAGHGHAEAVQPLELGAGARSLVPLPARVVVRHLHGVRVGVAAVGRAVLGGEGWQLGVRDGRDVVGAELGLEEPEEALEALLGVLGVDARVGVLGDVVVVIVGGCRA